MRIPRFNLLTQRRWTYVLAKPRDNTSRGNWHVVNWFMPPLSLCRAGIVPVYDVRRDEATGRLYDVVDTTREAFADGTARRGLGSEATCRKCRSILRHMSPRSLPTVYAHELALEEHELRKAAAAREAKHAGRRRPQPAPRPTAEPAVDAAAAPDPPRPPVQDAPRPAAPRVLRRRRTAPMVGQLTLDLAAA